MRLFGNLLGSNGIAEYFGGLANGKPSTAVTNGAGADPENIMDPTNSVWANGWTSAVVGANSPTVEDMNSAFYALAYQLAYGMQSGIPEYDSSTTYYTGSFCQSAGIIYKSITDGNIGNAVTNASYWSLGISAHNYFHNGALDVVQIANSGMFSTNVIGPFPTGGTSKYAVSDRIYSYVGLTTHSNALSVTITPYIDTTLDVPTFAQTGYNTVISLGCTITAANNVTDNNAAFAPFSYVMEGCDSRDFIGRTITLGFWFKASLTGSYSVGFSLNRASGGYYIYTTLFSVIASNTWEYKTITLSIPIQSDYVEGPGASGMKIVIAGCGGSLRSSTTTNTWETSSTFPTFGVSTSNQWWNTTGATSKITLISLTIGSGVGPTGFTRSGETFLGDLDLCQRYFQYSPSAFFITSQYANSTTATYNGIVKYQKQMVSTPGAALHNITTSTNVAVSVLYTPGADYATLALTPTAAGYMSFASDLIVDAQFTI